MAETAKTVKSPEMTWGELARVYTRPRVIAMMFLGFSGGLPFLLVFSTLTLWLRDDGVSKSAIGFFAWVGITYSIKVVWASVVNVGHWLRRSIYAVDCSTAGRIFFCNTGYRH